VISKFAHEQPAPTSDYEFYAQCRKHDWLSDFSDDPSYVKSGELDFARLQDLAEKQRNWQKIFQAFVDWFYGGCQDDMPRLEDIL